VIGTWWRWRGEVSRATAPAPSVTNRRTTPPPRAVFVVTGLVVDRDTGQPIDRGEVVLRGETGEHVTPVDGSGAFRVEVPGGVYGAFARGEGVLAVGVPDRVRLDFGPRAETIGILDDGLVPRLAVGEDLAGIELAVARAGTIRGAVLDPDGAALPGAVVHAQGPGPRPVTRSDVAMSEPDGTFQLVVPAGNYVVRAHHPRFAGVRAPQELEVTAGMQTSTLLGMARGCVISGRVVRADGRPSGGGALERFDAGRLASFGPAGRIEADGTFWWATLSGEDVTLRAWPWRSPPSAARTFGCRSGARFDDVVFRIPDAEPAIAGTLVDARGAPVPFAYVEIAALDALGFDQVERTDAGGRWAVYAMPPGRHQLTATAPGRGLASTLVVAPKRDVRLQLGGTGRIAGTTTALYEGSFEAAFAQCDPPAPRRVAVEDPLAREPRIVPVVGGRFVIEDAPACTLELVVRARGHERPIPVVVDPDRTVPLELELGEPREKTVVGTVRDGEGRPIEHARVTAVLDRYPAASARSDAGGRFTLRTYAGAQLVASSGALAAETMVGRANVATERIELVLAQ
jgi:hypothetical protein